MIISEKQIMQLIVTATKYADFISGQKSMTVQECKDIYASKDLLNEIAQQQPQELKEIK